GNHTNTHPVTTWMSEQEISKEILITEEKIYQQVGLRPKLVRAPYNLYPQNLLNQIALLEMTPVSWNVDPMDWRTTDKDIIVKRILDEVQPGSIILLHDGPPDLSRARTLEALPSIISELKNQGYKFVTVTQLLEYDPTV